MGKGSQGVRQAMAAATPVEDEPFDPSAVPGDDKAKAARRARSAKRKEQSAGAPPPPPEDAVDDPWQTAAGNHVEHLTPEEWAILEQCASFDENDTDNGKRLLKWFGGKALNVHEAGWYNWVGTHWDIETGQHAVERFAQQVVGKIKREAALLGPSEEEAVAILLADQMRETYPDPKSRDAETKEAIKAGDDAAKAVSRRRNGRFDFAVRTGDRGRTKAMIDQAEPHCSVQPRMMDAEDLALNTPAGTLRFTRKLDPECPDPDAHRYIVSKRLDPHNPADLITKCTAATYDPKAKATRWLKDFERFMPDKQDRDFLQVFMGYSATGSTGEQVYAFLYGDGSNWKSAFLHSAGRALGTYTKPMNYASVAGSSQSSGDKASPDWARLPGVRLLTIEEVPKTEPLKEDLIKVVTSGSDMPVRHLNKGFFDMRPTFTGWMTSNGEPYIRGGDHGIWRRTLIVRWERKITDGERLPFDQVMAMYDEERDGILNWIIEGIEKYLALGLKPFITDEMRAFTESVRRDRDAVGAFIEDCVQHTPGNRVTARELYRAFQRWCAANGIDPVPSETSFGLKVKRVPVDGMPMEKRKRSIEGVKNYDNISLHNLPPAQLASDPYERD
ncbi:DNA primase/helicase, phage-associated [Devosia sp. DBB001]|nr:DNA primase/helicase, phage-associated [Devosia sp. DBB001]